MKLPALIVIFLILRLTTLLSAVEHVSWVEELDQGAAAQIWMQDLKLPVWRYSSGDYHGGGLVVAALTLPFFSLLGPSLFVLKLVPLLFSLGALLLLFLFLQRFFDQRTAILASLLYIFAPPAFTQLSFFSVGFHPESNLFSMALLFCFYKFLYGTRQKKLFLILFGVIAGLGFWFCYTAFLMILTCLIIWFLIDRNSLFGRGGVLFLVSFFLGLTPWISFNLDYGFNGLKVLKTIFLNEEGQPLMPLVNRLISIPFRMGRLVFYGIPGSFSFLPLWVIPGKVLSYLYYATILFLVGSFVVSKGKKLSTRTFTLLFYPLIFVLLYGISTVPIPGLPSEVLIMLRYFSPLHFFSFPLVALSCGQRRKSQVLFGLLLVLGLIGQTSLLFKEPFGNALRYKGYSYSFFTGRVWADRYGYFPHRLEEFSHLVGHFSSPDRRYFYLGLSDSVKGAVNFYFDHPDSIQTLKKAGLPHVEFIEETNQERLIEMIHKIPAPYRPYFFENLGLLYGKRHGSQSGPPFPSFHGWLPSEQESFNRGFAQGMFRGGDRIRGTWFFQTAIQATQYLQNPPTWLPTEGRPWFNFSLGKIYTFGLKRNPPGWMEGVIPLIEKSPLEEKAWVYRGMGSVMGFFWSWGIYTNEGRRDWSALETFLAPLPASRLNDFFWGMGWGFGEAYPEDRIRVLDWVAKLPKGFQTSARAGLESFEANYGLGKN